MTDNIALSDTTTILADEINIVTVGDSVPDEETFLSECWTLYFHDPDDNQWTANSYKIISHISTLQDWCYTDVSFTNLWFKGMFFIMREHIQPLWEDPHNKEGGCFSFKVNKPDVGNYWFNLISLLLGGKLGKTILTDSNICGVSISPKRNYCILRIWIQTHEFNNINLFNLDVPSYSQVMYKSHNDNNDFDGKEPKPSVEIDKKERSRQSYKRT